MKISEYADFQEAVLSFQPLDKEFISVRHELDPTEEIRPHYHPKATEWIIVCEGTFDVQIGDEALTFYSVSPGEFLVIEIPKKEPHTFYAQKKTKYHVYRERKDRIIYCK
ncbi:MAG: cupin domain-containing protein [Candidatus Pacebacteria bacterium]|nr:cupin domain-containing protein [Candidatus Paceibacterota bacterium]